MSDTGFSDLYEPMDYFYLFTLYLLIALTCA